MSKPLSENKHLLRWVDKMADLVKPDAIHWVDGSQAEYDTLCGQLVASGTFTKLNEDLWPGCFYARSDAGDIARVEEIWRDCLSRYGGPFLFGKSLTLADAMFAPVCSRFSTYDVDLTRASR